MYFCDCAGSWAVEKRFLCSGAQASLLAQLAQACKHENCQDDSSILHLQSRRTTFTCPHGEEEYTFAEWDPKLYAVGEKPANGITITDYVNPTDSDCQQPAILNDVNSADPSEDILRCDCNALVLAMDGSTDSSVSVCDVTNNGANYPRLELTFDDPQDIVAVTFQNIGNGYTQFAYTTEAGLFAIVQIPNEGRYSPSVVNLTQQSVSPENVKVITVL